MNDTANPQFETDSPTSSTTSSGSFRTPRPKRKHAVDEVFHDEFKLKKPERRQHDGCLHRTSRFMARNACTWLFVAFGTAILISATGVLFGGVALNSADFKGWWTRGTVVSNRCTQVDLLNRNRNALFKDKTGEFWRHVTKDHQTEDRVVLVRRLQDDMGEQGDLLSDQTLVEPVLLSSPLPISSLDDDVRMDDDFQHDGLHQKTTIGRRRSTPDLVGQQRGKYEVHKRGRYLRDLQLQLPDGCVIPGLPPDFLIPEDFEIPEGVEIPPGCEGLLPTAVPTWPPSVTPTIAPTQSQEDVLAWEDNMDNTTNATEMPSFSPTVAPTPNRTDSPTPAPSPAPSKSKFPPCDTTPYVDGSLFKYESIWPVWRTRDQINGNFLEGSTLKSLCEQEEKTQKVLVQNDLCRRCGNGEQCFQPWSLVFFARLAHPFGMFLNCSELGNAWDSISNELVPALLECARDINIEYNPRLDGPDLPDSCPLGFFTHMVDSEFYRTGNSVHTSTIFVTDPIKIQKQFELADSYARGDEKIVGAYDTNFESFLLLERDIRLQTDILLAVISAIVTTGAMIVHTKSLFLAIIGLMQIVFSFPIAYFTYNFGFDSFPFLNYVGIYVIFALGADDVFVAVDKWKNARMLDPDASTEDIAAEALPDAAEAMFLTTSTTAAAFLASAGSPIPPFKAFSVFLGLIVIFDYLLCIVLVFPAICIYDKVLQRSVGEKSNSCIWCFTFQRGADLEDSSVKSESLIRRILRNYHRRLHLIREPVFIMCFAVVLISFVQASSIERPSASAVRVFDENENQYEQRFQWNEKILLRDLFVTEVSTVNIVWGVRPGDTGDHKNPAEGSTLLLDETFSISNPDVQMYLLGFCDRLYEQAFAGPIDDDFICPMNGFQMWLQQQSSSTLKSWAYINNCGNAQELPIPAEMFDACMYAWSQEVGDKNVLARNITLEEKTTPTNTMTDFVIEVLLIPFSGRARPASAFNLLDAEFNLIQGWLDEELAKAPQGAERAFFGNHAFWWYDTNAVLLDTAIVACAIAMGATGTVMLFSSRSFVLTLFAMGTVGYVIISVAAMLISFGWTIGFLESVMFSILIGLSCDFVVHLCHAYTQFTGYAPRSERTLFALITMGPSILAAAFTTMAAAFSMLFAVIVLFRQFATVLLFAMLQACFGTFVVFIALVDYIGPCNPSETIDGWLNTLFELFGSEFHPADGMPYNPNLEVLRGKNPAWPVVTAYEDEDEE